MSVKGIAMPVAFEYTYRGKKHGEVELYFSNKALRVSEIDLLEPGAAQNKNIDNFFKYSEFGKVQCLVPLELKYVGNYEAPHGVRFGIGILSGNPTTATMLERISFLPCSATHAEIIINIVVPHARHSIFPLKMIASF